MNFRRNKPRDSGARGKSSDWTYPQVERGRLDQARHSTALRTAAANDEVETWGPDPLAEYDRWVYGEYDYLDGRFSYPGESRMPG